MVAKFTVRAKANTGIPGEDEPAYTASKLYPYILARKRCWRFFTNKVPWWIY